MAKTDKKRQSPALNVEQQNAIDLLITGQTDSAVASAVGKSRQTICGWRLYHPAFQASLNQQRAALWGQAADKLRSLLPIALDILEGELTQERSVKTALEIIKLASVPMTPTGPQDVEGVLAEEARRQQTTFFNSLAILDGGPDLDQVRQEMEARAGA